MGSSFLGSPSPPPRRSCPQQTSLCRDGAEERISFCADLFGWFGKDQMFRGWMSRGLEGENGVRRMQDFCGAQRMHTGVKCQAVLLLHPCFGRLWGISLRTQQGRGQRGQALHGIGAGRIADSQRWCMASPSTSWRLES